MCRLVSRHVGESCSNSFEHLSTDGHLGIRSDGAHLLRHYAASRRVRTCVLPRLYAIGAGGPFDHVLLLVAATSASFGFGRFGRSSHARSRWGA